MNQYYFDLAGLGVMLQTPNQITISESLQPFQTGAKEKVDCTIELRSCTGLPLYSDNGVWHGLACYEWVDGEFRIFHCEAPKAAAFAVTRLLQNGNIQLDVLPAYLHYFAGSAGIFNRIGMETLLQQHKGLLLHASLIDYKGNAIAFTGPSGVGKSTQAALWQEAFGAETINGDRAALRETADGWMAYGSPYAGTSGIYKNQSAPLKAILVLAQAGENRFRRLSATEAFASIYPELSAHRWDRSFMESTTDLCLRLLEQIPVYRLECRPEADAVWLVKKGLGL